MIYADSRKNVVRLHGAVLRTKVSATVRLPSLEDLWAAPRTWPAAPKAAIAAAPPDACPESGAPMCCVRGHAEPPIINSDPVFPVSKHLRAPELQHFLATQSTTRETAQS